MMTMRTAGRWSGGVAWLGALAWCLLPANLPAGSRPGATFPDPAETQGTAADEPYRPPDRGCTVRALMLDDLARMSPGDLEQLYRQSGVGGIPAGYARGRPIYDPDAAFAGLRSRATRALWHGKHFDAAGGTLVNQWCGFRAIRARVGYGTSWLDGGPAIVMDYGGTSHVWADVRDEMREVSPGLFLGVMYLRRPTQPRLKMYFALELSPGCGCGAPIQ
jgi:hypothetical protein